MPGAAGRRREPSCNERTGKHIRYCLHRAFDAYSFRFVTIRKECPVTAESSRRLSGEICLHCAHSRQLYHARDVPVVTTRATFFLVTSTVCSDQRKSRAATKQRWQAVFVLPPIMTIWTRDGHGMQATKDLMY